jgi:hypothetical protein
MGKNVSSEQTKGTAEIALNEIIYSDNDIIASLDSQFRGGTESSVNTETASSEKSGKSVGISVAVQGGMSFNEEFSNKIIRTISPHDSKIINLISELGIVRNKETESFHNGQLVLLDGSVHFFDVAYVKRLFEIFSSPGLSNALRNVTNTSDENFFANKDLFDVTDAVLEILPKNPTFVFKLRNSFEYMLPLKEHYLRHSLSTLNWAYGSKLKGDWSVFGIYSASKEKTKATDRPSPQEALWQMNESLTEFTKGLGMPADVVFPILIYRKLTF